MSRPTPKGPISKKTTKSEQTTKEFIMPFPPKKGNPFTKKGKKSPFGFKGPDAESPAEDKGENGEEPTDNPKKAAALRKLTGKSSTKGKKKDKKDDKGSKPKFLY